MEQKPAYQRVLLKLSGEALAAGADGLINTEFVAEIAEVLKKCLNAGVEIVVAGSAVFKADDIEARTREFVKLIGEV